MGSVRGGEKTGRQRCSSRRPEGGGEIRRIYTTLRIVSQSKNDRGRNQKKEVGTGIKGYGKREDWTPNFPLKDYVHLIFVATSTKTYQTLTIFFQTQILSGMIRL